MKKSLLYLIAWGVLFGYMEAAVVVYLREIYYPDGFTFPLVLIDQNIMLTELLREGVTLFIMWTTVSLTYQRIQSRVAAFFLIFGVWDIFYYVFLKLLLNWPDTLVSWDILFLIPLPWVGPVWAPVLISVGFIISSIFILTLNHMNRYVAFDNKFILLELFAASMIIFSFVMTGRTVIEQNAPIHFPLYLFLFGFLLGIGIFLYYVFRSRQSVKNK